MSKIFNVWKGGTAAIYPFLCVALMMRKCVYPLSPLFSGGLLLFPCPQFRSRIYYIVFFYVTFNLVYFILICLSYIFLLLKDLSFFFPSLHVSFFSLYDVISNFSKVFSWSAYAPVSLSLFFYLVTNHRLLAPFYYLYFFLLMLMYSA